MKAKTVLAGSIPVYPSRTVDVFVRIEFRDGRLSITGVEGPRKNGDAWGSCGQITDTLTRPDFTPADGIDAARLASVWDRWHLNDMRPHCEHQRGGEWDTARVVEVQPLVWSAAFHALRRAAKSGKATAEEYAHYAAIRPTVERLTTAYMAPKHPDTWGADGADMLARGYVELGKVERKTAGWVYPVEHPYGLLTKACAMCGYAYGSAWKREEVPEDVLAFLWSLPVSPITPAWV